MLCDFESAIWLTRMQNNSVALFHRMTNQPVALDDSRDPRLFSKRLDIVICILHMENVKIISLIKFTNVEVLIGSCSLDANAQDEHESHHHLYYLIVL